MTGRAGSLIRQFLTIESRYLRWPHGRRFGVRPQFEWNSETGQADLERLLLLTLRILHATGMSLYEPPRSEYERYMQSPEWDERRRAALAAAGYRCELCGVAGVRLTVHHWTYERLGRELPEDLGAFCDPCHKTLEGLLTPEQAGMATPD